MICYVSSIHCATECDVTLAPNMPCITLVMTALAIICFLYISIYPAVSASAVFMLDSGCTCPGYDVSFTCIIPGGGNTIWKGSAFDCPSSSDSNNNQILLLHSRFGTDRNPTGSCNDGGIQGGGVSAVGGRFTSQLIVTITPSVVGKEVQCVHDNTSAEILIGNDSITVTTGSESITVILDYSHTLGHVFVLCIRKLLAMTTVVYV